MDKYLIKPSLQNYKSTFELLGEEISQPTKANIVLGFLGSSTASYWTTERVIDNIINPVIGSIGQLPDSILLPTEGATSLLIQVWGERQNLPLTPLECNWQKLGRKAKALRDGRILKESSHLVLFLGKRSDTYEKIAIREVKKGKRVFTVDADSKELAEWVI